MHEDNYGLQSIEYEDLAYVSVWYHRESEVNNQFFGERFIQLEYEWRKSLFLLVYSKLIF